jgi:hypothetical protein
MSSDAHPPRQAEVPEVTWQPETQKRDHYIVVEENGMDAIPDACRIVVKDSTLVIRLSSQMHSLSKDLPWKFLTVQKHTGPVKQ